jgi:hypothetical protein
LRERAEVNGVRRGDGLTRCGLPSEGIPSDIFVDGISRLSASAERDGHRARGRDGIFLNARGANAELRQAVNEFASACIATNAGDHARLGAERTGVISEVRRRAAELTPTGQNIPEQFAETDDLTGHGVLLSATNGSRLGFPAS